MVVVNQFSKVVALAMHEEMFAVAVKEIDRAIIHADSILSHGGTRSA